MKRNCIQTLLLVLAISASIPAFAQAVNQHIIVIVQENRTPDNLFAGISALQSAGAEVKTSAKCNGASTTLQPFIYLDACFNPNHDHGPAPIPGTSPGGGFEGAYNNGAWDGACNVPAEHASCYSGTAVAPNYTYVNDSPASPGVIDPYVQIVEQYGFSNWMFSTQQGPSFLGHQFIFSGTSAPASFPSGSYYDYFAVENPANPPGGPMHQGGCGAPANSTVLDLWSGYLSTLTQFWPTESYAYTPPSSTAGFPCYDHPSMANLLDAASISWKYYIQDNTTNWSNSIWTAPNALSAICGSISGGVCTGSEFTSHVVNTTGQILTDISGSCGGSCSATTCLLPQVSWVIPDGAWSDHPGDPGADGGPSWVAAIVNAIGAQSHGYPTDCGYWGGVNNTTILITWDDWGGWYDHVPPYLPNSNNVAKGYQGASSTEGNWFVYGFRVPLLVVSAFVNGNCTSSPCTGYVSGTMSQNSLNNGEDPPYIHDFGSILGFIEHTYSLSPYNGVSGACGIEGTTDSTCSYPYADYYAPDSYVNGNCSSATCQYPLWDFFNNSNPARPFTTINHTRYPASCFSAANAGTSACFGSHFGTDADDE